VAALPAFLPLCQKPVLLGKVRGGVSADNGGKLQAGQGGDAEVNSVRRREIVVDLNGTLVNQAFPQKSSGIFRTAVVLPHNVSAVTAACLMLRKQVFQEVNGFDENYPLAFGDVDLCLSILQKGYLNVWTFYSELYHHESKARGGMKTRPIYAPEKVERFRREVGYFKHKWATWLKMGDPFYNPNLTLEHEDFSIDPRKNTHPTQFGRGQSPRSV
jgi:hypothetical protein